MARYDDLDFDCLIDAVDDAYAKSVKDDTHCVADGPLAADILRALGAMLSTMSHPSAEAKLATLAEAFDALQDQTEKWEEMEGTIDTLCVDILDIEEEKLPEWVTEHAGKTIVVLPDGVDKEDIDSCIDEALDEIERNKR